MKKCFVISPIGKEGSDIRRHADEVFECLIAPAVKECGMEAYRSDHLDKPGWITDQVYEEIYTANVCIADLTSGNPNVFYELGVAQSANRPVITLIEKGQVIPFDIRDFRCIEYKCASCEENKHYIDKIVKYIREYEEDNYVVKDLFAGIRHSSAVQEEFQLERLRDRSELYKKAIELIGRAAYVSDTTWGMSPRKATTAEEKYRRAYRQASEAAIQNGVIYRDLFSSSLKRADEIKKIMDTYRDSPNYEARCIEGIGADLPVIDFLLTDSNEILFSHVTFRGAMPVPMYVYIKSETLSEFYAGLFNECWVYADTHAVAK
jgi:hypothetical protein